MRGKKIKVIIKDPGSKPRSVNISNSISNLEKYIQNVFAIQFPDGVVVLYDAMKRDEAKKIQYGGVDFWGTVILCGGQAGGFEDIPYTYAQMKEYQPQLWEEKQ